MNVITDKAALSLTWHAFCDVAQGNIPGYKIPSQCLQRIAENDDKNDTVLRDISLGFLRRIFGNDVDEDLLMMTHRYVSEYGSK